MNEGKTIVIMVGLQAQGATYMLHPASKRQLQQLFPEVPRPPSVYVGFETQDEFEQLHGPMWKQVIKLLLGLSDEELKTLGPVLLRLPRTGKEFEVAA